MLPNFVSLSFPTISSSGPNGAVLHYRPVPDTARKLSIHELYLCDSGAQYLDGTTDVTRTVSFGEPSFKEKVSQCVYLMRLSCYYYIGSVHLGSEGSHCSMFSCLS